MTDDTTEEPNGVHEHPADAMPAEPLINPEKLADILADSLISANAHRREGATGELYAILVVIDGAEVMAAGSENLPAHGAVMIAKAAARQFEMVALSDRLAHLQAGGE